MYQWEIDLCRKAWGARAAVVKRCFALRLALCPMLCALCEVLSCSTASLSLNSTLNTCRLTLIYHSALNTLTHHGSLFKTFWAFREDWANAADGLPPSFFPDDSGEDHPDRPPLSLLPSHIFKGWPDRSMDFRSDTPPFCNLSYCWFFNEHYISEESVLFPTTDDSNRRFGFTNGSSNQFAFPHFLRKYRFDGFF